MSTSVTAIVNFSLLYLLMSRRVGPLETRQNTFTLAKLAVAGAALAAVCLFGRWFLLAGYDYFSLPEKLGGLFTVIVAGGLSFFGVSYLAQIEEMQEAVSLVARKFRGRGNPEPAPPGLPIPEGLRRVPNVSPSQYLRGPGL